MAEDEAKKATLDLKGDGFKSRKFIGTMVTLGVTWTTATVAWLVFEKMEAASWLQFNQWVVPILLATYGTGNVAEKFAAAKAQK